MGIYSKAEVLNKLSDTDTAIRHDVIASVSKEPEAVTTKLTDNEVFFQILDSAWSDFFRIAKSDPDSLDKYTSFNQEYMGHYMLFTKEDYIHSRDIFLSNLLRVMYEYNFWTGERLNTLYLSHKNLTALSEICQESQPYVQFTWIRDTLPITLVQWMLNSKEFVTAKGLVKDIDQARSQALIDISRQGIQIKDEFESAKIQSMQEIYDVFSATQLDINKAKELASDGLNYIKNALKEINALEKRIKNLKSEYNFVGLSSGFNKIKEKREQELKETQINYQQLFGCVFIAPVIVALIHFFIPNAYPKDYSAIFLILPFFTIEMILIYFFRLSYLEAKSIRTQLVQIELRLSLCAFIDEYVDYRKRNNSDINKILERFDSLIFSPIQANENNIPAMFDGIEALAGLADKVIKK